MMRKRIIPESSSDQACDACEWLNLEQLATAEITSEDTSHPIESALSGQGDGWHAAWPGPQTVRIVFDRPQRVKRIHLEFFEPIACRTQEFVIRWSARAHGPLREIVRQQWNFSPPDAVREIEEYRVELAEVEILELAITPDISGGDATASLKRLQIA